MVRIYDELPDGKCRFVVIIARCGGKFVFCRHRERETWEFPGGHIEPGETALEAAKRELNEETGATVFEMKRAFGYSVVRDDEIREGTLSGDDSLGIVFIADVEGFGSALEMEIGEIRMMDEMPEEVTYPEIYPYLTAAARERGFI